MDSSAPFPLFSSLRVVGDMNSRPFISHLSPKGPISDTCPNAFSPSFGTVTGRNPQHWYRSCMAGYGRLTQIAKKAFLRKSFRKPLPQGLHTKAFYELPHRQGLHDKSTKVFPRKPFRKPFPQKLT
ncbi:hypothetical protein AVEN_159455-1 [Araneus ventricosus]|uniref:Uncharacterized protein n=1 Tax=Araneus ventricosus TaxID=182803 RepID=A0A4Y2A132_ARAVE|nr:hypothetical protein AVEN_159455-1 [Araneus ventricosus]